MEYLIGFAVVAAAIAVGYFVVKAKLTQGRNERELEAQRRRAENKVRMSDPILRADIEILEQTYSEYLNDAIALRRAQIEQGRDPGA